MTEDSIPPLLLQTIITIPIFWYTKKGGPKGKLVMNEEYTRKDDWPPRSRKPEEPHKWLTDLLPVLLLCDSAGIVARAAALDASLQHCGRVVGARCPV